MSDALSPLRRLERFLGVRLIALERQLPADGGNHELWPEYVQTGGLYRAVHADLVRPHRPDDNEERRGRRP